MAIKYDCVHCHKQVTATKNDRYRSHTKGDGTQCGLSSVKIPEHILAQPVTADDPPDVPREGVDFATCPQCERKVKLTSKGYFQPHNPTLMGGERCPVSGVRAIHARRTEDVPLPEPSVPDASSGASTETPSPESTTTSMLWREWTEASDSFFLETAHAILMDALGAPEGIATVVSAQPDQPQAGGFDDLLAGEWKGSAKAVVPPMGDLAKELATRIKETFYAYSNRKTKDNRSAQTTLGPSEIGTPCDRRLAMALMGIPAVNAGGDGWAAFVGTCTHVGMAEVYTFADAGSGRYAVELPVFLGVPTVPRGTTDLLDRRDGTVVDWKVMGFSSLKKFKEKGPSDTYRTQAHVYGLGAERGGEKVRNVAIVALPRGGFSLDEMHIWTEKYDRKFAQAALDRVEKIAQDVEFFAQNGTPPMQAAAEISTGDDCSYCPFHLKGDKEMKRGCPGK